MSGPAYSTMRVPGSISSLFDKNRIYNELSISQASGIGTQNEQPGVEVVITGSKQDDVATVQYQKPAYVAVGLIMAMTGMAVFFPMLVAAFGVNKIVDEIKPIPCPDQCVFKLVESIPENLTYPSGSPVHTSTFTGWKSLLNLANDTLDIASLYWTLKGDDIGTPVPSDKEGQEIYQDLLEASLEHRINIRIARSADQPDNDTAAFIRNGSTTVRSLNFTQWFGGGVLHTKLWIIDQKHFYVGSANMDWRSLTQVKELGVVIYNCSCLAKDIQKIFDVYWYLGKPNTPLPSKWPSEWRTKFNNNTPASVRLNDIPSNVFISSSPAEFCPQGRIPDLDAILHVINTAEEYVHIAVMDYFPTTLYTEPRRFWPIIDDALRRVSLEKGVKVRVLASWWKHSRPDLPHYLLSLAQLNGAIKADIQVKLFHVPATKAQSRIPFARVNHNKYMVTDNTAYIGTSNWSGDYFIQTGGIGLVVRNPPGTTSANNTGTLQQQVAAVFERDWNSVYALNVTQTQAVGDKNKPKDLKGHNDL